MHWASLIFLLPIAFTAGCIGQNPMASYVDTQGDIQEGQIGSVSQTEGPKWGFNYCGCGLHFLREGAEQECYNLRALCSHEDRDPNAESCQRYKELFTDLYQEGSCNPNWDNEFAVALYCFHKAGIDYSENAWLVELCGPPEE